MIRPALNLSTTVDILCEAVHPSVGCAHAYGLSTGVSLPCDGVVHDEARAWHRSDALSTGTVPLERAPHVPCAPQLRVPRLSVRSVRGVRARSASVSFS